MSHPLIGRVVVVLAANYVYSGTLEDVTPDRIVLFEPAIIYETGAWSAHDWKDAQRLPTDRVHLERTAVESMFELVREVRR